MNDRFPTSNKNMTLHEGQLLFSSAAHGQLAGDSMSDEGTLSEGRIMSNQNRVPLHERGINIEELTFEMVAPEGDKVQCVEHPDIFLEAICGNKTFKSTLFLLQYQEVWIGVIPLDPRLPETISKSVIADGNVNWVLDRFGDRERGRSFSSEKYNPTMDTDIPEMRFVSREEQDFVLKLAIALFSHHDGTITFSRNRRPERTYELNHINVALSDYLVSKLESGEMIHD